LFVLRLPSWFPLRATTALLLGVLHALGFLDDQAWVLQCVALAGLLALNSTAAQTLSARSAGLNGFAFGLGWFLSGVSWVYVSLTVYGDMAVPVAALGTFLLCAWLSVFPAAASALHIYLIRRWHLDIWRAALILFPALWMFSEWGRGTLLTGFPWLASGYAHTGAPLAGFAPLLGVYGVSLVAALVAALIALLGAPATAAHPRARWGILAGLCAVLLAGALLKQIEWSQPAGKPISVRLLQGNIPQDMKFSPGRFADTLAIYEKITTQKSADLIVLPETALPRFLANIPTEYFARLAEFSRTSNSTIALGVPIADPGGAAGGRYTNSVVAITPQGGAMQRYDKSHLVPFGEFIPRGFAWFVAQMNMPLGSFAAGMRNQAPMQLAGRPVAFNICYEDLFGAAIARQAAHAQLLVNVSNVAWFGDSLALPQHLQISRMRAIESARPMVRSTNTGMTAAIDARGHVLGTLEPFSVGSLDLDVQGTTGNTPYVRWQDSAVLILGLIFFIALAGEGWVRARRSQGARLNR